MKNRYTAGANFERRVIKHLEAKGWDCARTAGSHGFADIWAIRDGELNFIQCQTDKYFAPAKREAIIDAARRNGCIALLCWRGDKKEICMEQVY